MILSALVADTMALSDGRGRGNLPLLLQLLASRQFPRTAGRSRLRLARLQGPGQESRRPDERGLGKAIRREYSGLFV